MGGPAVVGVPSEGVVALDESGLGIGKEVEQSFLCLLGRGDADGGGGVFESLTDGAKVGHVRPVNDGYAKGGAVDGSLSALVRGEAFADEG